MSEYVTDPELLRLLNGTAETAPAEAQPQPESQYITDPAVLNQLNASASTGAVPPAEMTAGAVAPVAPAITGAAYGAETGLPQLAQTVKGAVGPAMTSAGAYLKNPLNILTDVALTHMGVPPVAGMAKLYDTYKGARQVFNNLGEAFTKLGPNVADEASKWVTKLDNADQEKLFKLINEQGVDNAIKNYKAPAYLSEEGVAAFNATKKAIPSYLTKAGAVTSGIAGPVLRGLGRVAGPAGMAMNMYDAANYAQESGLGQRLAQGEGARGMQAFQNLNNRNVSGYMLNPVEAKNLLASGDERTINMYGGKERLQGIISAPNAVNSGYTNQLNNLSR